MKRSAVSKFGSVPHVLGTALCFRGFQVLFGAGVSPPFIQNSGRASLFPVDTVNPW